LGAGGRGGNQSSRSIPPNLPAKQQNAHLLWGAHFAFCRPARDKFYSTPVPLNVTPRV